jgi:hypothetical protein
VKSHLNKNVVEGQGIYDIFDGKSAVKTLKANGSISFSFAMKCFLDRAKEINASIKDLSIHY